MERRSEKRALRFYHALLSGGGSGGHIIPALAVADALLQEGWKVTFAGSRQGLEGRLVPEAGYPMVELSARPWVGKTPTARAKALGQLCFSTLRARRLVRQMGVDVVLATGGYASVPGALGSRLAGIPLLLLEPNVQAGTANRWLSRWAQEACVVEEETARFLRCPAVTTGVPIRGVFPATPPPLPWSPPVLLVLGGSQGARPLNELVPEAIRTLVEHGGPKVHVVHQAGTRHQEEAVKRWQDLKLPEGFSYEVHGFLPDVPQQLLKSTLVVSRAGAVTLAEIAAAGRPSVLVPLDLAGGHQRANALRYVRRGAALIVEGGSISPFGFASVLQSLLFDRDRLEQMARSAHALACPHAAREVAQRLARLAEARKQP